MFKKRSIEKECDPGEIEPTSSDHSRSPVKWQSDASHNKLLSFNAFHVNFFNTIDGDEYHYALNGKQICALGMQTSQHVDMYACRHVGKERCRHVGS